MLLPLLFFIVGIPIGILINRAADNLPYDLALWQTPVCPYCGTPRTSFEQLGILSFVLRRDKCHNCGAPLNLRTPLVEIATAALFAFLAVRYSWSLYLVLVAVFTAFLLLIAVIDLEHKLILNGVVFPAGALAVLASPIILTGPDSLFPPIHLQSFYPAIIGSAVGYFITLGFYYLGVLFLKLVNRRRTNKIDTVAFGLGDVKLAAFLGALIGFPAIIFALIYAILFGGIGAVIAIALTIARKGRYSGFIAIPYGPYLILAGWGMLIFGGQLTRIIFH